VADDHAVTRRGVKEILQDEFANVEFGEAFSADETCALATADRWDLILLDIMMPGASIVDTLTQIRRHKPSVPILILTAAGETEYAVRTLKAGANGFINKQHATDELIVAIKRVMAGETYLSSAAAKEITAALRGNDPNAPSAYLTLSERERQVFRLIAGGKTVKEIAAELEVSDKTVSTYLSRIREKTGLVSYVEITRYALQQRLVE
jgi:two-component system, NarL family, invasion response regulator UvrY